MFVVPEAIWSPLLNFYYELLRSSKSSNVLPLRDNFLQHSDHFVTLKRVLSIQLIGLALVLALIVRTSSKLKWVLSPILIILIVSVIFVIWYALNAAYSIG